jgi:hypothetical protein
MGVPRLEQRALGRPELRVVQRPLRRVMAFLGYTIDELCNDRVVKNRVLGYFKLYKEINRRGEMRELERQWNPAGLRF